MSRKHVCFHYIPICSPNYLRMASCLLILIGYVIKIASASSVICGCDASSFSWSAVGAWTTSWHLDCKWEAENAGPDLCTCPRGPQSADRSPSVFKQTLSGVVQRSGDRTIAGRFKWFSPAHIKWPRLRAISVWWSPDLASISTRFLPGPDVW